MLISYHRLSHQVLIKCIHFSLALAYMIFQNIRFDGYSYVIDICLCMDCFSRNGYLQDLIKYVK